jgi:hypothetical protein
MEEILASIRRIIADDVPEQAKAAPARPVPVPAPAPSPSAPVPMAPAPAGKPAGGMNQNDIDALLAAPGKEADDETDVLELTQPAEPAAGNSFRPVSGADVVFREERSERTEPAPAPTPAPAQAIAPAPIPNRAPPMTQAMTQDELLSPASTAAVSAAFGSLASTILSENARTLEDLVQEMMRPMLKDWLDENLPGLVERMVRAEIERVSRGGR